MEDRVPLTQAQDQSPTQAEKEAEAPGHQGLWQGTLGYMDDINYHRMADLLEISYEDRKDQHLAEKLSLLTDWAKEQTKSDDRIQQYQALKNLTSGLGYQMKGKELATKLYQWIRLDLDRKRIEAKQELLK